MYCNDMRTHTTQAHVRECFCVNTPAEYGCENSFARFDPVDV